MRFLFIQHVLLQTCMHVLLCSDPSAEATQPPDLCLTWSDPLGYMLLWGAAHGPITALRGLRGTVQSAGRILSIPT